jgi:hypothetical protein
MVTRKAVCKFAASAAVAVLLVGSNVRPAHAELDFTLYNVSGRSVYNLYVTPANDPGWGRDVLREGVLLNGENTRITFPGQGPSSPCIWDVKVVYSDRTSAVNRFDLCTESSIYAR